MNQFKENAFYKLDGGQLNSLVKSAKHVGVCDTFAADRMTALINQGESIDEMQRAANEYDAFSHMVEFIEALEDKKAAGVQANG